MHRLESNLQWNPKATAKSGVVIAQVRLPGRGSGLNSPGPLVVVSESSKMAVPEILFGRGSPMRLAKSSPLGGEESRSVSGDGQPDEPKGPVPIPGTAPDSLRDVSCSCHAQYADCQIAQGCHHLRPGIFPDARAVLIESHVAYPVNAIFDRPVVPVEFQ